MAPIREELDTDISDTDIVPLVVKSEPIVNDGYIPYVKQENEL